jgi:hypothetical protein
MPSTHLSLHYHIFFSTKDRHPFVSEAWRGRWHEYLGALIQAADAIPEAVGGRKGFADVCQTRCVWLISGVAPRHRGRFSPSGAYELIKNGGFDF